MSKERTSFDPAKDRYIVCMACAPRELVELKCVDCLVWKGLDQFSKAQRKKPSSSNCLACMEEIQNMDASVGDEDKINVESDSEDDLDNGASETGVTLAE